MTDALFGYTGFVGGNLLAAHEFGDRFNSANAADSAGRSYGTVVFSAAKAEKWRINQDPEGDLAHIAQLEQLVSGVEAERFVLISTVDVYKTPIEVDETTPIETEGLHAYGLNRYRLEQHVRQAHPGALIVRLPGLFGPGLKKNVIFDLLHDNNVERIHSGGAFQYYNLRHLWRDIELASGAGIELINLTSEPIRTDELAERAFGIDFRNEPEGAVAGRYDMRTVHADLFGAAGDYSYSKEQTLAELTGFVAEERARA